MKRHHIRNPRAALRKKRSKARKGIKVFFGNLLRSILVLLILSFFGFLGKWFYSFLHTSPGFNIEKVAVRGLNQLSEEEVLSLLSLDSPQNIFNLDLREARERVETHPRVAEAIIYRQFPRILGIRVTEREPIALINREGGFLGVDAAGVLFPFSEPLGEMDLPLITGIEPEKIITGRELDSEKFQRAIKTLNSILSLDIPLMDYISEVNLGTEKGMTLYTTTEAAQIRIGEEDLEEQILNLAGAFCHLEKEGKKAEYVDLRFKGKVIVKEHK